MRVRGETEPQSPFTLESYAKRPGFVLARFYENAVQAEDATADPPIPYWTWDEFHLILRGEPRLQDDIAANLEAYRGQAMAEESTGAEVRLTVAEGTIATHDQEIDQIVTGLEALANG